MQEQEQYFNISTARVPQLLDDAGHVNFSPLMFL